MDREAHLSADEKTCPRCAETVKAAAQVCRFCGFDFAGQRPPTFKEGSFLTSLGPNDWWVVKSIAVVVGAVMVGQCVFGAPDNPPARPDPAHLVDAQTRASCADAVAKAQRAGVVKGRPSDNRVNVDELVWARMTASDKAALLSLLACDAFGKRAGDLEFGEHTVAYGARSGKRLAMLSSAGASFE